MVKLKLGEVTEKTSKSQWPPTLGLLFPMSPFVNQPQASQGHIILPGHSFAILLCMGKLQSKDHDLHMETLTS